MALDNLIGTPRRLVRFASLVIGLLMAAAVMVCLLYAQIILAVASAIVSAWALLVFVDTIKSEFAELMRSGDRPPGHNEK